MDKIRIEKRTRYSGYYVYADGRVEDVETGKFIKRYANGTYRLRTNAGSHDFISAHKLVAIMYLPESEPGHDFVKYKDGDSNNLHYTNLEWCMRDTPLGAKKQAILDLHKQKLTIQEIVERTGCTATYVRKVFRDCKIRPRDL